MATRTQRAAVPLLLLMSVASAGCNPEAGMWTPKNPGSVSALVRDTSGTPVAGAQVMVEIPNNVGSTFKISRTTSGSGRVTIHDVPEGTRAVDVTPPAGYTIDPAQRVQLVEVRENKTTSVTFVLVRTS